MEVVTAGEYPGDGKPKPVSFPNPQAAAVELDGVNVLELPKLIELKATSGLSAAHPTLRDLADVQMLIETLHLPSGLAEQLDPSVRGEYARLWGLAPPAGAYRSGPAEE